MFRAQPMAASAIALMLLSGCTTGGASAVESEPVRNIQSDDSTEISLEARPQGWASGFWITSNVTRNGYCLFRYVNEGNVLLCLGRIEGTELMPVLLVSITDDGNLDALIDEGESLVAYVSNRWGPYFDIHRIDLSSAKSSQIERHHYLNTEEVRSLRSTTTSELIQGTLTFDQKEVTYVYDKVDRNLKFTSEDRTLADQRTTPYPVANIWALQNGKLIISMTTDQGENFFSLAVIPHEQQFSEYKEIVLVGGKISMTE